MKGMIYVDESLEIVNHIYKDSEMAISTLTKLSTTLEKKDNKIKDTVEDIIKGYERYFKDAKKILNKNNCKKEKNGIVSKVMANMGIDKEVKDDKPAKLSKSEKAKLMVNIENEMKEAAKNLDFERAMELRDILFELKSE